MASFKAQKDLLALGSSDDDSDDDDEYEREEDSGEEEAEGSSSGDDESEEAGEGEASEVGDAEDGAATSAAVRRQTRKREKEWLAQHFMTAVRTEDGQTIFRSEIVEDRTFFSRRAMEEFAAGKRYKRLLHDMKKGLRTYNEVEKLKRKKEARLVRQRERREDKVRAKRKQRREAAGAGEIEERKAKFQAKKARRLARKAAGADAS